MGCSRVLVNSGDPSREFLPFGSTLTYDAGRSSTSALTGRGIKFATVCILET
jgi:hypothetical protein